MSQRVQPVDSWKHGIVRNEGKAHSVSDSPSVTQEFLDSEQYTTASIRAYEAIYGRDFVSPGGERMARELVRRLALEPGNLVLDAGCGLGGSAFLMTREFGLQVDGIDLSRNMINIARQKCEAYGLGGRVRFEHGDCLTLDRLGHYQAIYSRDVFLHIHDKRRLFDVLFASLSPGGVLLFTDYCYGEGPWQANFTAYVESRAYCLHTLEEYTAIAARAGFVGVRVSDLTGRFSEILQTEMVALGTVDMEEEVRRKLEASWQAKLKRVRSGDQRWGLVEARRPHTRAPG